MLRGEVTLKDVAEAVGKSVATVSKALHGHQDIAPETRERISAIARQLGYSPNITARRLQKQRTDAIGLILPVLSARQSDPFFTELLAGVADEVAEHGFDLLTATRSPGAQEQAAYRRLVQERRVDGAIVAQPRRDDWRIEFLINQQIPFVVVGYLNDNLVLPGVLVNTAGGMAQAVAHLLEQGKTTPALIPPPADLNFHQAWLRSFEAEMAAHPELKGQISAEINDFSQKEGYRAGLALLNAVKPPDAIIACHDLVAVGAMTAAQDQGFEIGNDIAIIGFGDIPLAEYTQPPLTTLHQPTYQMGQQACRILLATVAGQLPITQRVVVDPWLVVRQSSNLALWL